MNIDAINADPILKGTPIGDLKVVQMNGWVGVAVVDARTGAERVIHVLDEGSTVFDAIYGKRAFELPAIRALYETKKAREEVAEARHEADVNSDFVRELARKLTPDDAKDFMLRGMTR